jgi:hypothetical protein
LFLSLAEIPLHSQVDPAAAALPDAPQAPAASQSPAPATALLNSDDAQSAATEQSAATASVSGTVMDSNGGTIQGARVAIRRRSGAEAHIIQSGADGQFEFTGLPPGPYELTVTARGMTSYVSPEIQLQPGGVRILPQITLNVEAAATSVTVNGDNAQLSVEQVQIAVQQRVMGIIPNFYTTYDWNAPPMLAKQKFALSMHSMFDPTAFAVMAGIAGAEQYKDVYPAFGGGLQGYGKRFGATFANHVSGQFFGRAVYPAIFHQDPRYFYKGKGSFTSRAMYAISATVIARGDNGRWGPNYSNVLGDFTSAGLSNFYYPQSERGAGLVFFNGLTLLGGGAAENLIKEFILKGITSHIPKGANGQP